jgi:hypothetical protein
LIPDELILAVAAIGSRAEVLAHLGRLRAAGATDVLVDPGKVADASIRAEIAADNFA